MKKLLLSMAAVAMLASCSSDEIVEQQAAGVAIGFDKTFIDNGTRSIDDPSYSTTAKPTFAVYGWMGSTQIFSGTTVTHDGTDYGYSPLQYWTTGHDYEFAAVVPSATTGVTAALDDATGNVKITVTDFANTGTTDLLFATAEQASLSDLTNVPAVNFTFKHMLSKVKISFASAFETTSLYTIKVTDIKITDAKETGTLEAVGASYTWNNTSGTKTLDFGAAGASATVADPIGGGEEKESYYERLLIPATADLTITFTAELFNNGASVGQKNHTAKITALALQPTYCYDLTATLTPNNVLGTDAALSPITFTVNEVTGWTLSTGNLDIQ